MLLAGALPLLVAAILTDNPYHAVAADDLAVAANALYGSTYFHRFTYILPGLPDQSGTAVALEIGLFHQALVLMIH